MRIKDEVARKNDSVEGRDSTRRWYSGKEESRGENPEKGQDQEEQKEWDQEE
jgi:hypothetical protein